MHLFFCGGRIIIVPEGGGEMLDNYLIIHKSILPEYYEKVLEARRLLEDGKVHEVSQAVKQVGISRSTYYKYKDFILEPIDIAGGRKAVLSMMLTHEQGVVSALLARLSHEVVVDEPLAHEFLRELALRLALGETLLVALGIEVA